MVGLLADVELRVTTPFKAVGDLIFVVGEWPLELGGSEYLASVCDIIGGTLPELNAEAECRTIDFILRVIDHGLVSSCHDVSDGGVAVALCESALGADARIGFRVQSPIEGRSDAVWFGEGGGRFVVSVNPERADRMVDLAYQAKVGIHKLGTVNKGEFEFADTGTLPRDRADRAYVESLPRALATTADFE